MTAGGGRGLAGNLPPEATGLVGRRAEIAGVRKLLLRARLVTLTGVAGVGKTRLALRVAAGVRGSYRDGVWLVDVAWLPHADLLACATRTALCVDSAAGADDLDVLVSHVRDRRLLLVLDNCEHLVDGCAEFAYRLLRDGPGLRVLVTSRQPLNVLGEHVFVVSPLPVSDDAAIRLFAMRAAATRPGFTLDERNRPAVARICGRLDGLPLGIELAAARVRELSPAEIARRLDRRADLLGPGGGSAERHGSLRSAIEWSYRLCPPSERTLWTRLGVFSGGFELDAVEDVCVGPGLPGGDMLRPVAGLVDRSVMSRVDSAAGSRYHMLDTIREFALGRPRWRAERARLCRRHRDWYARLAERGEAAWFGAAQESWAARLRAEHANIRAALTYCLTERGEAHTGLRMFGDLWFYWLGCGFLAEGGYWARQVLDADRQPDAVRVKALWVASYIALTTGPHAQGATLLEECADLARHIDDRLGLARAVSLRAMVAFSKGDFAGALRLEDEAAERYRAIGHLDSMVLRARARVAMTYFEQGETHRAVEVGETARALCDRYGDRWVLGALHGTLARCRYRLGDLALATSHARESLRISRGFGDTTLTATAVEVLAWLAAAQDRHEAAAVLLGAADPMWRGIGTLLFGYPAFTAHHDESAAAARAALGDAVFNAAFARGGTLTLDEVERGLDESFATD